MKKILDEDQVNHILLPECRFVICYYLVLIVYFPLFLHSKSCASTSCSNKNPHISITRKSNNKPSFIESFIRKLLQ